MSAYLCAIWCDCDVCHKRIQRTFREERNEVSGIERCCTYFLDEYIFFAFSDAISVLDFVRSFSWNICWKYIAFVVIKPLGFHLFCCISFENTFDVISKCCAQTWNVSTHWTTCNWICNALFLYITTWNVLMVLRRIFDYAFNRLGWLEKSNLLLIPLSSQCFSYQRNSVGFFECLNALNFVVHDPPNQTFTKGKLPFPVNSFKRVELNTFAFQVTAFWRVFIGCCNSTHCCPFQCEVFSRK